MLEIIGSEGYPLLPSQEDLLFGAVIARQELQGKEAFYKIVTDIDGGVRTTLREIRKAADILSTIEDQLIPYYNTYEVQN